MKGAKIAAKAVKIAGKAASKGAGAGGTAKVAAKCFPGTARLNLHNGKSVKMSDIQVGDKAHSGTTIFFPINPTYVHKIYNNIVITT